MEVVSALKGIEKKLTPVVIVSTIIGALAGIGLGYVFVVNNVYRPSVQILSVDWENGTATIKDHKTGKKLYAGSVLSVGLGDWGIQFSGDNNDRIELVKNGLTYKTLQNKIANGS